MQIVFPLRAVGTHCNIVSMVDCASEMPKIREQKRGLSEY